ncbi:MAG TPA: pilus assembly protein TadG-related protein [Acidimicrobiia bacterium]|nr:pilus assembly protein TadG-related protein [Acidimicrobiia bacterium]
MEPQDRDVLRADLHSERGATAIIVASAMLVLLGFAAFAVDISAARNEQRLDQAAADAAALAGAVEFLRGGRPSDAAAAIVDYAEKNLGRTIEQADWGACTDTGELDPSTHDLSIPPRSSCISFGPNDDGDPYAMIRVRLPNQETATTFGRALGVQGVETFAAAEVTITRTIDLQLFPAGVASTADVGDLYCLGTGTSDAERCNGAALEMTAFDPCVSMSVGLRDGVDALTGTYSGDVRPLCGTQPYPNAVADTVIVDSGDLMSGLVNGRLDVSSSGALIDGNHIENRPLWEYIDTSVALGSCLDAAAGPPTANDTDDDMDFEDARGDLAACLNSNPPDGLFVPGIYNSPRFVLLPMLTAGDLIVGYLPAYLDSIWTDHGACAGGFEESTGNWCRHDPGRVGSSDQPAKSVSLRLLSCDVLPDQGMDGAEKCMKVPGPSPGSEVAVFFEFALSG